MSRFLFQDVLGSVVLVVLEPPEEHERGAEGVGLLVAAREEHEHRLAGHDALQVVQHVVRPDVREYLADAGEEEDVEVAVVDLGADRRRDVELRVEHALEELAEVVLVLVGLRGQYPLPDAAFLEDFDGQVVEVDLANADALLAQPVLDPLLGLRDGKRVLRRDTGR